MLFSEATYKHYAFRVYFTHDKNFAMPHRHCSPGIVSRVVDLISQTVKVRQGARSLDSWGGGTGDKSARSPLFLHFT